MRNYRSLILASLIALVLGWTASALLSREEGVRIQVVSLNSRTAFADIAIEYPQFPELSRELNDSIKSFADDALKNFTDALEETEGRMPRTGDDPAPYYLAVTWQPSRVSEDTLSFVLRGSSFSGGAHGSNKLMTFSWNPDQDVPITLDDVFTAVPGYREKISAYARAELLRDMAQEGADVNRDMLEEGTEPTADNFSRFTIEPFGMIRFYFPEYQVAPYVFGEQQVLMPVSFVR